jgi:molybdopterin/thiamine biosynthesis adenylyltransferase
VPPGLLLKPALRRLWRDRNTLQLGLEPPRAKVLTGLDDGDRRVLELLDGTRERAGVHAAAAAAGVDLDRADALLDLLEEASALSTATGEVPASLRPDALSWSLVHRAADASSSVQARRSTARVDVLGAGRVGAAVTGLLAAAGVGEVCVRDDAAMREADVSPAGVRCHAGGRRDESAATELGGAVTLRPLRPAPSLRVVAPAGPVPDPATLARVASAPHLLVVVRETVARIGPLVLPGRSPCVRCLELARAERDPHWPSVAAQLVSDRRTDEPCDVTLATLAAALAAMQVLQWLDGDIDAGRHGHVDTPTTVGGVLVFDLCSGLLRRRSLSAHPECGCAAAPEAATIDA